MCGQCEKEYPEQGCKEASRAESLGNGFDVKKGKIMLRKDNTRQKIVTEDVAL